MVAINNSPQIHHFQDEVRDGEGVSRKTLDMMQTAGGVVAGAKH
jgi:hypothetical protein